MRNLFKLISLSIILLLSFGTINDINAQTTTTKKKHTKHSLRDSLRQKVLQRDSMVRSFKHTDGSINNLLGKIEDYTTQYNEISSDLSKGFDTLEISQRLPQLERRMALMKNTIDNSTTLGYLFTIRDMIDHITEQMTVWETQLSTYNDELEKMRSDLATFKADTALRTAPTDSTLQAKYYVQVHELEKKWARVDSCSKKSIIKIGFLENGVSTLSILLIDLDDRIDAKIHLFTIKATTNEYGFLWDMHKMDKLDTAISRSYNLNFRLYRYFLTSKNNYYGHLGSIILLIAFLMWIISSRRKTVRVNKNYQALFDQTHYIVKHPIASAITITAVIGTYFYDHPPQVFAQTTLLLMLLALGFLIRDNWPKPLFRFWVILLPVTLLFSLSDLLILIPYFDRWLLLLLSGISIYAAYQLIKKVKLLTDHAASKNEYPPHLEVILKIFIALNAICILLNIAGRFSLAKIISTTAVFNLCLGMGMYILVQMLMESLFLQLEANKADNGQSLTSYLDFKLVQKKFKDVLVKVTAVMWLVALTQNLNIDDYIYDHAGDFLSNKHQFSSTAFTFGSILTFIIVIWISGLIARVISYFYDFASQQQTKLTPKAKKTRSSILLIRLTIFVIGFFVAITAAGIPMDRVTIIIGALGVGIGFGLQNIVNNLVSGVILAFEKPVQVGDIIEVSGKAGTIKEIGIRASKIACGDGSELIVPNGDLISQHVVNWTLTDNNRQVELVVGVAYGTDIAKVDALLKRIVNGREDIMKSPAPSVLLHNFSDSAVDFKVQFWADDISNWAGLKSSVMSEIYTEFTKEGIEIPHPKRDIQVYFPEGSTPEDISKLQQATKNPPAKDQ
ncbi:mechanosensitive ion channel family protein [Mucilaginibacter sp. AW1-3]